MSTLETQYQSWLKENSKLSQEEWMVAVWAVRISKNIHEDVLSDWDVTLYDGLEDNGYIEVEA